MRIHAFYVFYGGIDDARSCTDKKDGFLLYLGIKENKGRKAGHVKCDPPPALRNFQHAQALHQHDAVDEDMVHLLKDISMFPCNQVRVWIEEGCQPFRELFFLNFRAIFTANDGEQILFRETYFCGPHEIITLHLSSSETMLQRFYHIVDKPMHPTLCLRLHLQSIFILFQSSCFFVTSGFSLIAGFCLSRNSRKNARIVNTNTPRTPAIRTFNFFLGETGCKDEVGSLTS